MFEQMRIPTLIEIIELIHKLQITLTIIIEVVVYKNAMVLG
jgi:hypothetical protein